MKNILILSILSCLFISCKSDDDSTNTKLIGNWKLIEVLADPGDGSGDFVPVNSNKTISFLNDGTISSNGNLCDISIDTNSETSGTYSISESSFSSNECINPNYAFSFEQNDTILIIEYPCIEPCKAKYLKL